MTANRVLDGKMVAALQRKRLKSNLDDLVARGLRAGLALICVGDHPASQVYIRNKITACDQVGIKSWVYRFEGQRSERAVLNKIVELNSDDEVHGILVQLPLPRSFNIERVIEAIDPAKDVDGFHPVNIGKLFSGKALFSPCTPWGIMRLIDHYKIQVEGKHAVVVGRSAIVGKPMAIMLLERHSTVTICTSKTTNLSDHVFKADILVVAAGKQNLIRGNMVKKGAVVIDVGINELPDGSLTGDVDFSGILEVASWISPVPGGVGPMTIAGLLTNTVKAFRNFHDSPSVEIGDV